MSSTIASASRNTRSWSGQRGPTSASTPITTAVSVEIAMPHAFAAGPPALSIRNSSAGTVSPPIAAIVGAASARTPRSSPSTISREISSPTLKKNNTMSPSLTQCRRSRARTVSPKVRATSVCQNSS